MIIKKFVLLNRLGLHARAAKVFIDCFEKYEADVSIKFKGITVNARSILGVLMLRAFRGDEITVIVDGDDEKIVMETIEKAVTNKFNESEYLEPEEKRYLKLE